jgi:nascent polypeptide-associated complex subunit beta
MPINPEKLKALQAQNVGRAGGVRRKVPVAAKPIDVEDKKVNAAIAKINARPVPQIEEVNMFKADNSIIHFPHPKVSSAVEANTWIVQGYNQNKQLTELLPGILTQLGADNIGQLQSLMASMGMGAGAAPGSDMAAFEGNFEDAANGDAPDLVDA